MKNFMLLFATGLLGLALVTPASAQYYPSVGGHSHQQVPNYTPGYGGYTPNYGGYTPNYGGYTPNYGGYTPGYSGYAPSYGGYNPGYGGGYNRGHIDVVPGGRFSPPHVDYHIGGRRYEVQPTPYGPVVSPFHHHGR